MFLVPKLLRVDIARFLVVNIKVEEVTCWLEKTTEVAGRDDRRRFSEKFGRLFRPYNLVRVLALVRPLDQYNGEESSDSEITRNR
ncbi:hypothetical protein NC652_021183 [Populus alba x Populus x berolinensis]|nr:hypothetical protein NC652_021183 [Populus alba x Populus x berolinensis]